MFEEGQLYSPVTQSEDGTVEVHLGETHPGFTDAAYRSRRGEIAAAALSWAPGQPAPRIDYTSAEEDIWRLAARELAPKHDKRAR